jgi:hypothetical protein
MNSLQLGPEAPFPKPKSPKRRRRGACEACKQSKVKCLYYPFSRLEYSPLTVEFAVATCRRRSPTMPILQCKRTCPSLLLDLRIDFAKRSGKSCVYSDKAARMRSTSLSAVSPIESWNSSLPSLLGSSPGLPDDGQDVGMLEFSEIAASPFQGLTPLPPGDQVHPLLSSQPLSVLLCVF